MSKNQSVSKVILTDFLFTKKDKVHTMLMNTLRKENIFCKECTTILITIRECTGIIFTDSLKDV